MQENARKWYIEYLAGKRPGWVYRPYVAFLQRGQKTWARKQAVPALVSVLRAHLVQIKWRHDNHEFLRSYDAY